MRKILLFAFFIIFACKGGRNGRNTDNKKGHTEPHTISDSTIKKNDSASFFLDKAKVYFFIENSGSMYGYVRGKEGKIPEYVETSSKLYHNLNFVNDTVERYVYLINGHNPIDTIMVGKDSHEKDPLEGLFRLDKNSPFKQGNPSTSDLNTMFQIALEKAKNNDISILISDGIYDIKQKGAPQNELAIKGNKTSEKFLERLQKGNLETILVKLKSDFNGHYYYVSKVNSKGQQKKIYLNQKRPFYVWIFGKPEIVEKYFPKEFIEELPGYENDAKFLILKDINVPYKISTQDKKGRFKLDRNNPTHLIDAEKDPREKIFQYTFMANYDSLPFSDDYFENKEHYQCESRTSDYIVKKITPLSNSDYTHKITLFSEKRPYGKLNVHLKYVLPKWLDETNTLSEDKIDENTTYGFKYLIEGISDAYFKINGGKDIYIFKFYIEN